MIPPRADVLALETAMSDARDALAECLWDEKLWDAECLVLLMERVYLLVGGDLSKPPSHLSPAAGGETG